jgi:hypothetical protein
MVQNTTTITVRLDKDLKVWLDEQAAAKGQKLSLTVAQLVFDAKTATSRPGA